MKKLRDVTWKEIFDGWRQREASNPGWQDVAKQKGWPDWESWRSHTAEQAGAAARKWELFIVENPNAEIPNMLIGPYGGWQSRMPDGRKNAFSFADLLELPEQYAFWNGHDGIRRIADGLPFSTDLIGVRRPDGKITLLEGHHRATAIALAKKNGVAIDWSGAEVRIALTTLADSEENLLDDILKRGTSKELPKDETRV